MRHLLNLFSRPSHYTGNEAGAVLKDPRHVNLRIALAFPDTYEVGMSYLGHKILYSIVNARPGWQAERVMAPEADACRLLRERGVPLATLESDTPLNDLAAIGFAITHELCFTDVLNMLDLANIPLRFSDRPDDLEECPVIMAGGGAMLGGEPLAPFMDLVQLGDGEELLPEVLELLEECRRQKTGRIEFLRRASGIHGVYIPSLSGPDMPAAKRPARRIVADLNDASFPVEQIAPVGAVHDRLTLEIARGCARGCRFCHAGMVYRPVRERSPETVARLLDSCLEHTGFDEVSFLALSAGDCTALKTIYSNAWERCQKERITLALPSLRVGSVDDDIMSKMSDLRRTGCTLAPEAGSQRLRDVINKGVTEEALMAHLAKLLEHGWRHVKLYFMIGLPTETDDDLREIAALCKKAREAGGPGAPRMQITAAISPFVPKPFTPFQWEAQIGLDEIARRISLLRAEFKNIKGLRLKWHEPASSHLEGILSRGDRRLADVVEKAYRKGAFFCGWSESFSLEPWLEALAECGLDANDYIRARHPGEKLAWDHIEAGVSKEFLWRERERAYAGKTTDDCRFGSCAMCGACSRGAEKSRIGNGFQIGHKLVFTSRDQETHQPATDENGRLLLRKYSHKPPRLEGRLGQRAAIIRCWHQKTGTMAFLSHLELQTLLGRAFRRAGLPLAFSQGYHPLPQLSFGRALPVGAESLAEWFTIGLHAHMAPDKAQAILNERLPSDLRIWHAELTDKRAEISASEIFEARLPERELENAVGLLKDFFAREEAPYTRQTKKGVKTENLRSFLASWRLCCDSGGNSSIEIETDWTRGYISPVLLVSAIFEPLGLGREDLSLRKLEQIFQSGRRCRFADNARPSFPKP